VILPAIMPRSDDLYLRAISRFYNLGISPDWWKLPPLSASGWTALSEIIARRDPHYRGVVILGLDAPAEQLRTDFKAAAGQTLVKGFAVGRTLFGDAFIITLAATGRTRANAVGDAGTCWLGICRLCSV
ncbi:TPA: 2-deoxy-5-keto-D-gluconate 6-phosphate aldolase domain-containing protein, partial [Salmonella enterica]